MGDVVNEAIEEYLDRHDANLAVRKPETAGAANS